MTLQEMIAEVIPCIPSSALRGYFDKHFPEWTVMQTATIVQENCGQEEIILLFSKLATVAEEEADRILLLSATDEISQFGYVDEKTNRLYRSRFEGKAFPLYPFLEKCYLPVLFRIGDVISFRNYYSEVTFACIEALPWLDDETDFTGECYYCHDLSCMDPQAAYIDGSAHLHVSLCEADSAEEPQLTERQRTNLAVLRKLIAHISV